MAEHDLHKLVGRIVKEKFGEKAKLDFTCNDSEEAKQQLPLFYSDNSEDNSRSTQLCKVDMLIVSDGKVKVVIEIEESGMIPTKICGKFLTTGLAKSYSKEEVLPLANPLLFIQVLKIRTDMPQKSSIPDQWFNIAKALRTISKVDDRGLYYVLIFGELEGFENKHGPKLIGAIEDFLNTGRIDYDKY